jgi:hypothetical protein
MVAAEPDFGDVAELLVRGDFRRREMTVIIEDRLGRGVFVIEFARSRGFEEKILVHKRLGHVALRID